MKPEIVAINRHQGLVLTNRDEVMPIVAMFDVAGEPTNDPDHAISAAAGAGDCWFSFLLADFVSATVH